MPQPVLFLSHGAPTLPFDQIPARDFFVELGARLQRPKAILVLSAHWYEKIPSLTAAEQPGTIHDFFGFPKELYQLRYPAPGDPELAQEIQTLLHEHGIRACLDKERGFDHGLWNPMLLLYPHADVPIVQLSMIEGGKEQAHYDLGKALVGLREKGILILASGGAVHNLRAIAWQGGQAPDWAVRFDDWVRDKILKGDLEALLSYRALIPEASLAHPSDDHFLPLFAALGAAGMGAKGKALHQSFAFGSLSMACYGWGI